ncbi:cache domain-containing protein [Paenibacillus cymbidii]|uniref:cache domain-containing protein n=1 Tax=Paenibacillus cymbidii TaxID=1639034 RepID=UPI0010821909|nr:cache domain-containing protein [Paenibacillus cymbidii]
MNRIRPKSRVIFRIFLSYLLVFAVPFVVFAVFVYYNAVVSLRHGIEAANLDKLNQVRDTFDLMESSLEQTAARISIDPRLTPYMVRSGSYQTIEAIEELAKYKANNTLAEEVLLYFRGDDDIYSSKGKISLSTFTSAVYGFSDWNNNSLYSDLNEPTSLHIRPAEPVAAGNEKANMLTYLVQIPRNSPSPYATVMFIIRESVFTDRIKQLLGDFKGAVYVLDEKGNALASRSAGSRLGKEETVEALRNHADPGIQGTTIGREKYSVMVAKSAIAGWSYAAVMPTDQFMGRVLKMKTLVLLLCALVTGVGLAAAVLLTRLQYRPIRGIVEHIRSTLGGPAQPGGRATSGR